jgi:Uri superfamily endonuclease
MAGCGQRPESSDAVSRNLPSGPGTYVLLLWLPAACHLSIGRALESDLAPGYYLYVGSALRGLRGRLRRYLVGPERVHWHIDYLLTAAQPAEIWFREGTERLECAWASRLAQSDILASAMPRFGSSDCRCPTHLFYALGRPSPDLLGDPTLQVVRISPNGSSEESRG